MIYKLEFGKMYDLDLSFVQEDVYNNIAFSGNKARKILKIAEYMEENGYNAVVTTGGLQSNHTRVTAQVAAKRNWPCRLILHGAKDEIDNPKGNLLLMLMAGADIAVTEPGAIEQEMNLAAEQLSREGYKPYIIPGGGHCLHGALAFLEASREVINYCTKIGWYPDWVIVPSGTGTTQAGITAGFEDAGLNTRVVGVSVAREKARGKQAVIDVYEQLGEYAGISGGLEKIDFRDDWVGEGYEVAGQEVWSLIGLMAREEGIFLDPTYTGKAFLGLVEMAKKGEIVPGSRVLFWHTGGLFNLLAADKNYSNMPDLWQK